MFLHLLNRIILELRRAIGISARAIRLWKLVKMRWLIKICRWVAKSIHSLLNFTVLLQRTVLSRMNIYFLIIFYTMWCKELAPLRLFFHRAFPKLTLFKWILVKIWRLRVRLKVNSIILVQRRILAFKQRVNFWNRIFLVKIFSDRFRNSNWLRELDHMSIEERLLKRSLLRI